MLHIIKPYHVKPSPCIIPHDTSLPISKAFQVHPKNILLAPRGFSFVYSIQDILNALIQSLLLLLAFLDGFWIIFPARYFIM